MLIQNRYLAVPSKVNLNFLMIYPPVNIPEAIVGMVMNPRDKRKNINYIHTIILECLYICNIMYINQIHDNLIIS